MKFLHYKFVTAEINHGTEENPDVELVMVEKQMGWSEAAEEIVKKEAYNGEYTIEDDGIETVAAPTHEERFEALEAAVAMLCMPDISEV
jgi:hypothetical protein